MLLALSITARGVVPLGLETLLQRHRLGHVDHEEVKGGSVVTVVEQREDDLEAGAGLSTRPDLTGPAGCAQVNDVVAGSHQLRRVQVIADPLAEDR